MTEMWTHDEARKLTDTASYVFKNHGHTDEIDADEEDLVRSNCGACVLAGYAPSILETDGAPQPNYAGWARVYVQARQPIPAVFREAFEDERVSDNTAYAAGLARDVATFGVTFTD